MLSGVVRETSGWPRMPRMKMGLSFKLRREHLRCDYFDSLHRELQIGSIGTRSAQIETSSGLKSTGRIALATSWKSMAFDKFLEILPQRLHYRSITHPDSRSIGKLQCRRSVARVT